MKRRIKKHDVVKKVRHNINLLDRPLFVASSKKAKLDHYTDDNGFTLTTVKYGLPTIFDKKMLYLLMYEAQKRGTNVIEFKSVYELVQSMGLTMCIDSYRRVDRSLKRLANTRLEFTDESFYETSSKSKSVRSLAIVGDLLLSRDKICVTVEQAFLDLHEMQFTRNIPIATIMKFTNPVALRLFEIACKIIGSNSWFIGLDKLQGKLAITYDKRRDAIRSLDAAQKEIREIAGFEHFGYKIDENDVVTFKKKE